MATIDVVNANNEKVGSLTLSDEVFGGPVNTHLVYEAVHHYRASQRRGTHATKNRALVSGSGRKPWRQKGTGRARVGEIRNPLWRKGGTVFGPQPRSYGYALPRKAARGALRSALAARLAEGAVVVVDRLATDEAKSKAAAEMLRCLGVDGKALLVDVHPDANLTRSVRNLRGVKLVASRALNAYHVLDASRLVLSREALARLQEALAS